ncbi:MAG: ASKHA domain-containing protein, partial [Anaerolineales bacterium]
MSKQHTVILQPSGRRGHVDEGLSLREAARHLGVEIESICAENATCGKCKVLIEDGIFERYGITSKREHLSPPGLQEVAYFNRRPIMMADNGWEIGQIRLSCQAKVLGDVLVNVPEESRGNKQIVRKSATEREIEIKPSVRKYLVEMSPPDLEQPFADWERLSLGLSTSMKLVRRGEENLPEPEDLNIDYQCLRGLGDVVREGNWKVTATVWQDREVIRVQPGYVEKSYGAAVDIGSTTIALYLCDLETGEILAAESEMNPQIVYGEDVMSRIQYTIAEPDGLEKQHKAVIGTVNGLLKGAVKTVNQCHREEDDSPTRRSPAKREETGEEEIAALAKERLARNDISTEDILEIVFVGNTTMHHLLLNLPPANLGHAPYVPAIHKALDIKARELGLEINPSGNVHVLPTIASFIGADTSGVLIAEEPHKQDENWLIIDVGTNAELVLGNRRRLICTSTPTGPAVEGAHIEFGMRAAPGAIERVEIDPATMEPRYKIIGEDEWNKGKAKGICGSAIIDLVAEMFKAGILDSRGRFKRGVSSRRVREGENGSEYVVAWAEETSIGRDIHISIKDIRQIQLAKGALYVAAR